MHLVYLLTGVFTYEIDYFVFGELVSAFSFISFAAARRWSTPALSWVALARVSRYFSLSCPLAMLNKKVTDLSHMNVELQTSLLEVTRVKDEQATELNVNKQGLDQEGSENEGLTQKFRTSSFVRSIQSSLRFERVVV